MPSKDKRCSRKALCSYSKLNLNARSHGHGLVIVCHALCSAAASKHRFDNGDSCCAAAQQGGHRRDCDWRDLWRSHHGCHCGSYVWSPPPGEDSAGACKAYVACSRGCLHMAILSRLQNEFNLRARGRCLAGSKVADCIPSWPLAASACGHFNLQSVCTSAAEFRS